MFLHRRLSTGPAPHGGAIIVGGGPACLALLLAASRSGSLDRLVEEGLTIVERGRSLGSGALGGCPARADGDVLGCVRDHPMPELAALAGCPEARALASGGGWGGAASADVGAFLDALGATLARLVRAAGGQVLTGCEALSAARADDGWLLRVRRRADGSALALPARSLVLATGGVQPAPGTALLAGRTLGERCGARLVGSHDVLRCGGLELLARLLEGSANPRMAILGGGASAMAAAGLILSSPLGARLGAGGLAVLHRRPLRSPAADRCDGFGADARLLLHAMRPSNERATLALIAAADVVVGALGCRPAALPLRDAGGEPIELAAADGATPLVDGESRMLDAAGAPLARLFGIGFAYGFVQPGGQPRGLRQWRDEAGAGIVERLLPDRAERARQLVRLADPRSSLVEAAP